MVAHALSAPAALPRLGPRALTVLSYNILLPNSMDGWWMYKMYPPGALSSPDEASWSRRSTLLAREIEAADADVVCLQEVSPTSFESDFAFMRDLGYKSCELFRKGRFRPATFWRPTVQLATVAHRDRCLITTFTLADAPDAEVSVINAHLQAGPEGPRRLRQVVDALENVFKAAKRSKLVAQPERAAVIVCGDFNGDDRSAAVRVLEDGAIEPDFVEDGETVTSKTKRSPFPPMVDAAAAAAERPPPPTLVLPELISVLTAQGDQGRGTSMSEGTRAALRAIFEDFSGGAATMNAEQVERWLVRINGQLGRGSEFRAAAREMAGPDAPSASPAPDAAAPAAQAEAPEAAPPAAIPPDGTLSWDAFCRVYDAELAAGKYCARVRARALRCASTRLPRASRLSRP